MRQRSDEYERNKRPPVPPKYKTVRHVCGHLYPADEREDEVRIGNERECRHCRDRTMGPGSLAYLEAMSDEQLIRYGNYCALLADAGIGYWQNKLQRARQEWRRRALEAKG